MYVSTYTTPDLVLLPSLRARVTTTVQRSEALDLLRSKLSDFQEKREDWTLLLVSTERYTGTVGTATPCELPTHHALSLPFFLSLLG